MTVRVVCNFITVPCAGLWSVNAAFSGPTYLFLGLIIFEASIFDYIMPIHAQLMHGHC